MSRIDPRLLDRLYRQAEARTWDVSLDVFAQALELSAAKRFGDRLPGTDELESYLRSLHLADLALACACAVGHERAWEHFVLEFRPALYRAADAVDPSGAVRELADSLYGELFGMREAAAGASVQNVSLFRYFHGRSTLSTWLRAVLAQRHVDLIRSRRRSEPLPEEESLPPAPSASDPPSLDRSRFVAVMQRTLQAAIAALPSRDRLRLGCYYAQQMTLAEVGRLLREHEATVSRNLARTRRGIREDVERRLRQEEGLSEREVEECFASVTSDPGPLDVESLLETPGERKNTVGDRSTSESVP